MSTPRLDRESPYETIKQAILRGDLAPRAALVETSLASWCNVSRTPIREALTRLEQDGLVTRTDRGLVVRERSPEEIFDTYETRIVLEAAVGRAAAERRTEHDLRTLRVIVDRTEKVAPDDGQAMFETNRQFHRAMRRASHNEALADLLDRLDLHLAHYPITTLTHPGRWEQAKREHVELVDAVERRDADAAAEISLRHFTEARDIRVELWERGWERDVPARPASVSTDGQLNGSSH